MRMPDLCLSALLACVAGCATERPAGVKEATFPLPQCQSPEQKHCVARLFVSDQEIESRDLHRFPKRYLELWDESVRAEECARLTQGSRTESFGDCQRRLAALSDYFNPAGQRPDDRVIGVALEGGGGKSAPFALGVLAGLHQLGLFSDRRVGAVASVSGGTYAASFLFNRLLDQHQQRPGAGDFDQWFRSCVPDAYGHSPHLGSLAEQGLPLCGELSRTQYTYNRFRDDYAFQGQVWQFPKVLFPDASNGLEEGRTAASVAIPERSSVRQGSRCRFSMWRAGSSAGPTTAHRRNSLICTGSSASTATRRRIGCAPRARPEIKLRRSCRAMSERSPPARRRTRPEPR